MFEKNDPRINRAGRPLGAVDKRWATLQYWADRLENTLGDSELSVDKRADIEMKMFALLLERKKLPPEDPDESKRNADEVFQNLKTLQEDARRGTTARSQ